MKQHHILEVIQPVRKRLSWIQFIRFTLIGCCLGLLFACIWLVIGRFWAIPGLIPSAFVFVGLGLAGGIVYHGLKRIDDQQAARTMDRLGLEDRMSTALQYLHDDSPIVRMQRQDAVERAKQFLPRIREALPIPFDKPWWIGTGALFFLFVILLVLPNPMEEIIAQKKWEQQWIEETEDQVADMMDHVEQTTESSAAQERLMQQLEELLTELQESEDALSALQAMEESLQSLEQLAHDIEKQQKKNEQWISEWQQQDDLRQIGDSLQNQDRSALRQGLESLKQQWVNLTPEQKRQRINQLNQLAASVSAMDEETRQNVSEALQGVAQQLEQNASPQDLQASLDELENALSDVMKELQQISNIENVVLQDRLQIAQQGLAMADSLKELGIAAPKGWQRGGIASSIIASDRIPTGTQVSQSGSNHPNSGSDRSGMSPGSEGQSGAGSGQAGRGQQMTGQGGGPGSSAPGSGAGSSGSAAGGLQGGYGMGSRNLVTTPRSLEGEGNVHVDPGPIKGEGGEIQYGGISPILDGASRPYEEVYGQYAQEAQDQLNRNLLPRHMQQLVRDYFIEIQPDR